MRRGFDAAFVLFRSPDGHDHYLDRGEKGRHPQTVVVAVRHDQSADQTCRYAPARIPGVLYSARLALELQLERLGKVLTEVVRSTRLQRLVVLHHSFTRVRAQCSRESLGIGFDAGYDRHRHPAFHEVAIQPEDHACLFLGFIMRGMGGMTLLPEKLQRS